MKKTLLASAFSLALTTAYAVDSNVIATVNGKAIPQSEIQRNLAHIPNYDTLPTEQQVIIKNKIVQAVTKLEAVVQEAKKLKIQETVEYKQQLKDFEQQLMYSTLLESHISNIITEVKLKDYYNENKKDYIANKAKASHILVETEKKAQELIQQLEAGASFAKLAEENSIGPSSKDGGNLGWFNKETMVSEFSNATFDLKVGTFSKQPIKTQFGWHIILLEDKVENTPSLFEDVKEKIRNELMQKEVELYLDTIINKAEIVINDENSK